MFMPILSTMYKHAIVITVVTMTRPH